MEQPGEGERWAEGLKLGRNAVNKLRVAAVRNAGHGSGVFRRTSPTDDNRGRTHNSSVSLLDLMSMRVDSWRWREVKG